jgi:hypothetical protein
MDVYFLAKDPGDIPHTIAHLYEHWFLNSFRKFSEDLLGVDAGVLGYISGETYRNLIFIECWFYHKDVSKAFEQFLDTELDSSLLQTSISQCATEDRESWDIKDPDELSRQLNRLHETTWQRGDSIKPFEYDDKREKISSPIIEHKTAGLYKACVVKLNLKDGSLEEKALFLRLEIILQDIINVYIIRSGWYWLNSRSPENDEKVMYAKASILLPKKAHSNKQLENDIKIIFQNLDVAKSMPYIDAHFKKFGIEPIWTGRPRDDLHYSDIVVGNSHIAKLATRERIERIISKLEIVIHNAPYQQAKDL